MLGFVLAAGWYGSETAETISSPFTQGLTAGQSLDIPVAHNEGNYFADDDTLDRLQDNGQIAFRYIASDAEGPANPNGAARDIAGILSNNGRVMGMMPHQSAQYPRFMAALMAPSYFPNLWRH